MINPNFLPQGIADKNEHELESSDHGSKFDRLDSADETVVNTFKFSLHDRPSVIVQSHKSYNLQCIGLDVSIFFSYFKKLYLFLILVVYRFCNEHILILDNNGCKF